MIKNCYIRVDANSTIGIGHLVRTEILSDKLAEKGIRVYFLCNTVPEKYRKKLIEKNCKVVDISNAEEELPQISEIINRTHNNILIIDSDKEEFYTEKFQKKIRASGIKLMIITFYNKHHFYADIVFNQNIIALSQEYNCEKYTLKLLGLKNVILNDEYRKISQNLKYHKNKISSKTVLLLTFGGVDKPNRTELLYKILISLKKKPGKIIIVLGAMYEHRKNIEKLAKTSQVKTEIYQNTPKMPYLLAEADMVFNSGGLTVWEAGVLKSLNVIIGYTERENIGGKYLHDSRLALYLGNVSELSISELRKKTEKILNMENSGIINNLYSEIDVNGIYNIVKAIINL